MDITYKDTDTKKTKNIVLYIGKKDSDEKNYYVQLKGSHMVYLSDKEDRKSTRLNSSHIEESRMPSSA